MDLNWTKRGPFWVKSRNTRREQISSAVVPTADIGGEVGPSPVSLTEMRVLADRIQARAVRRMGELLKQFDGFASQTCMRPGISPVPINPA